VVRWQPVVSSVSSFASCADDALDAWSAGTAAGGSVTNVPFITSPDFNSVEFSASESFTTAAWFLLATVRFDSVEEEDVVLAGIILAVVISPVEAVDTCAADVTLVPVISSADGEDVETLPVEGVVVTWVVALVLLTGVGFVRRCGVSVRLTGAITVP